MTKKSTKFSLKITFEFKWSEICVQEKLFLDPEISFITASVSLKRKRKKKIKFPFFLFKKNF